MANTKLYANAHTHTQNPEEFKWQIQNYMQMHTHTHRDSLYHKYKAACITACTDKIAHKKYPCMYIHMQQHYQSILTHTHTHQHVLHYHHHHHHHHHTTHTCTLTPTHLLQVHSGQDAQTDQGPAARIKINHYQCEK